MSLGRRSSRSLKRAVPAALGRDDWRGPIYVASGSTGHLGAPREKPPGCLASASEERRVALVEHVVGAPEVDIGRRRERDAAMLVLVVVPGEELAVPAQCIVEEKAKRACPQPSPGEGGGGRRLLVRVGPPRLIHLGLSAGCEGKRACRGG